MEKEDLDLQIGNLKPFIYTDFGNRNITVFFDLHMTLTDGKVLNILSGIKSCQLCPICGAGPKAFMQTKDVNSAHFKARPDKLKYGISPLHAWIRTLEFVLNVSYRIEVKKWQIRDENEKKIIEARKKLLQKRLWTEMGLHVNRPKQSGSGNMNDGNTARRAFSDVTLFSSILGFDTDLLHSFHMILIAISCEYEISALKSRQYSEKTYSLYMEMYPWYPMSPTLHKILIHGAQIIAASVVPLGCLGESASESRNKYYKSDRRSHARQNSRTNNMADVFQRAIDSSDPFLSSLFLNKRQQQNQKKKIPKEVIELLKAPNVEPHSDHLNTSDCSTDTDSDADSLCDIVQPFDVQLEVEEC
ncbi:PREDICTED: uncharacterized protein LOC108358983 [Rhagoletis zephyria]|uniref:uncharacterized protein LOC108358983 n=1 Tax=Rhagoletis zephyria TaxID=28612 RepID=UPI0008116EA2|nr:PREDICTED: uncharacterized protein LOC108358983 [Rhagoletis zephyria]